MENGFNRPIIMEVIKKIVLMLSTNKIQIEKRVCYEMTT